MGLVSASAVGAACGGLHHSAITAMARSGHVPFKRVRGEMRFDPVLAVAAVNRHMSFRRCSKCGKELPIECFRKRTHRSGRVGAADKCDACHKAYNRSLRVRDAAANGRSCPTRAEMAAAAEKKEALRRAEVAKRVAARLAARRRRNEKRVDRLSADTIRCARCHKKLPTSSYYPSSLRNALKNASLHIECRECSANKFSEAFKKDSESLSDRYVVHVLAKSIGAPKAAIKSQRALIEAKRAQLMLERLVNPRKEQSNGNTQTAERDEGADDRDRAEGRPA